MSYTLTHTGAQVDEAVTVGLAVGNLNGVIKISNGAPIVAEAGVDFAPKQILGSGAPTSNTPGSVGQHYINTMATAAPYEYVCIATPSLGVYTWEAVGSGAGSGNNCYVRYSAYADGTDFTTAWSSGQNYVGFATAAQAPTEKTSYTWCLFKGETGATGADGEDGISPTVTVTEITGGHRVVITDAETTHTFDVMNGVNGTDGEDGEDGISPTVSTAPISGGNRVTFTYGSGGSTAYIDVMNGQGSPGSTEPAMDGTASAGSSTNFSREDHVHPTDTSRAAASDLAGKQDTIPDLTTIRSGAAAGATAYQMPAGGVPVTHGGTGATSASDARASLGVSPVGWLYIDNTNYEIIVDPSATAGMAGKIIIVPES